MQLCTLVGRGIKMYTLHYEDFVVIYNPESVLLEVKYLNESWKWKEGKSGIEYYDGGLIGFEQAKCTSSRYSTGVEDGVKAEYVFDNGVVCYTKVCIERATGEIRLRIYVEGDEYNSIKMVYWPSPFEFCPDKGYSVLPYMQGVLLPAKWPKEVKQYTGGLMYERDNYMPMFGQVKGGVGYIAIYETPYDANSIVSHTPNGETLVVHGWRPSLGKMAYEREIVIKFLKDCDYNLIAKEYRNYVKLQGKLVTLRQKMEKNPNVAKLVGTPVIHTAIAIYIKPGTHYYDPDRPEHNEHYVSFYKRAEQLRKLKEMGVEKAYLHLDGWGKRGYDNLHPDVFPPYEKAGGAEGMKYLANTCKELDYVFGIHDQYHDYYYDAESFDIENAITDTFGEREYVNYWYGGEQTLLCTKLAQYYLKRNYMIFKELGIDIEGSYLDVFGVVAIRECAHKEHMMTRRESAEYRIKCLEMLDGQGIITSSEEPCDFILPSMALIHHAPFAVEEIGSYESEAIGIPIPLFNLVYHDCVVIPWMGIEGGGWNLPKDDWGFLHALLNGDTIYYDICEKSENIELGKVALDLHKKVCHEEMVKHEFLDETYRKQRTTFADGTCVYVDFEERTWRIDQK